MKSQNTILKVIIVILLIILFCVTFLIKGNDKMFSVGKNTISKEEMLWELHKNDYSNLIEKRVKEEIFLVNTKIKKDIKGKVEKNLLLNAEVKNKEELMKKLNLNEEEYNRLVNVQTAIVQQLLEKANIDNDEIESKYTQKQYQMAFNLFIATADEAEKVLKNLEQQKASSQKIELENAAKSVKNDYQSTYRWYISHEDLINNNYLTNEQLNELLVLSTETVKSFKTGENTIFVELAEIQPQKKTKLYIETVYELAQEKGVSEETVFEELKSKTKIKYFDEKYFE